ncbi:MAG TPA: hypothetical protein VGF97_09580 [Rhizomicrobium sp.]
MKIFPYCRIVCFAGLTVVLAAVAVAPVAAAPPVPFYKSHILTIDRIGNGSVVLKTKDSADMVCAWYAHNLPDGNGETKTSDGARIFYTHNGATVDVEPGNRFDPDTSIGIVWDARKFGSYGQ